MRGYQLFIFFGFINYCCCDSKIVEHLEKQLNNLIKKRNNGKPLIINGKMKKYRCIEEYIPVDEYGSIIEKEPLNPSSFSSSTASSLIDEANGIKEAEPKGGGYYTTTTTTTTTLPPNSEDSDAISPNGLNIQRIRHSPSPKYPEKTEKRSFHSDSPRSLPVDNISDASEFIDEEPEIRRSSERRPSEFRRPPPQREYDDYQYFESDRDYLGPEYYPRPTRIPYYSSPRSRIPTRNSHIKGIPSYEARRTIPYISNEYPDRHFYPPSRPRLLPRGRDDRWQSPIPVHALPPQRQQFMQSSHPLRPLPNSNTNNIHQRPPMHSFPTLAPHPLLPSPPPRQHPLPQIPPHPQPNPSHHHHSLPPSAPPSTTSMPKKNLQMTPENCQKVKSFAANFGVKNPQTWVRQNCLFAQTFVPNTSCEDLATFVDSCYRHHFL